MAVFGKVAREVFLGCGSTVGQAGVVTVVVLVRASHWGRRVSEDLHELAHGVGECFESVHP